MVFQDPIILCTAFFLTQYIFKLLVNIPNQISKLHILYPNIAVYLKEGFLFFIDLIKFVLIIVIKSIIMLFVMAMLYTFKYYLDNLMNPPRYKYLYFL